MYSRGFRVILLVSVLGIYSYSVFWVFVIGFCEFLILLLFLRNIFSVV